MFVCFHFVKTIVLIEVKAPLARRSCSRNKLVDELAVLSHNLSLSLFLHHASYPPFYLRRHEGPIKSREKIHQIHAVLLHYLPSEEIMTHQTTPTFKAIAVSGCGGDGRLGVGPHAPDSLPYIALIEEFLPRPLPSSPQQFAPSSYGEIRRVACGAYHTIVLTSKGLYGWGLHEDGQLGLGRPSHVKQTGTEFETPPVEGTATPAVLRPTRIGFFDFCFAHPEVSQNNEESCAVSHNPVDVNQVIAVACGANHSLVQTTKGLYGCGRNDHGQLGLGHMNPVYQWTLICSLASSFPVSSQPPHSAYHSSSNVLLSWSTADGTPAAAETTVQLLHGRLTHISGGTHHSLLAWADAVLLSTEVVHDDHNALACQSAGAGVQYKLQFYPSLLMSCGHGDFGELGYNPSPWLVMQAKSRRQQRALVDNAHSHLMVGALEADAPNDFSSFPWKPNHFPSQQFKKHPNKRRPAFDAAHFAPVNVAELHRSAVSLSDAVARSVAEEVCSPGAMMSEACEELKMVAEFIDCHSTTAPPTSAESPLDDWWEVCHVHAMHLHSAVTLQHHFHGRLAEMVTLHWGCYYCAAIEDDEASVPRQVGPSPFLGVHAGNEVLMRFATPSTLKPNDGECDVAVPCLQIQGGPGNLGLGSDDSFEKSWMHVPLPPCCTDGPLPANIKRVVGRDHFLILVASETNKSHQWQWVVGFGANHHDQLSTTTAAASPKHEIDLLVPELLVKTGDVVRRYSDTGTDMPRNVKIARAVPPAVGTPPPVPLDATATQWVVDRICDVGAGAHHSVFLLEVQLRGAVSPPLF